MVRVGGLQYRCAPNEKAGSRISDMRLGGRPIAADKTYKVAGWAPVAEGAAQAPGAQPIWDVVEAWFKAQGGVVKPRVINTPSLVGMAGNPGMLAT
jgi:sulfur-oxidizing protein SoxB